MSKIRRDAHYLWTLPWGRLAMLAPLVGTLGLTTHYWLLTAFVLALPRLTARDLLEKS